MRETGHVKGGGGVDLKETEQVIGLTMGKKQRRRKYVRNKVLIKSTEN
jgi:hypothetical protein